MKLAGIILGVMLISFVLLNNQVFASDSKNAKNTSQDNKQISKSVTKNDKSKDSKVKTNPNKKLTKSVYSNQDYGFSIEIPKGWFKREYPFESAIVMLSVNEGVYFSNPMVVVMYRHNFDIESNPNSLNDDKTINELLRDEIGISKVSKKKK